MHERSLGARLPQLVTERDELAEHFGVHRNMLAALPETQMRQIVQLSSSEHRGPWPCATMPALEHPGLLGMAVRCRALGYELALDTSLRQRGTPDAPRPAQELYAHLQSIGAYFSPKRKCVGLASDSAWHEAVHEVVHLNFDAHVKLHSRAPASARHPLRQHFEYWRSRGYGEHTAEEMVCREHELFALRSSGKPPWQWGLRALLVWDSALVEAEKDLDARRFDANDRVAAEERRRVQSLRRYVTGPRARATQVAALGLVVITMTLSLTKRVVGTG